MRKAVLGVPSCAFCPDPIRPGQNHSTNPRAHIHCAHANGMFDRPAPTDSDIARGLRNWLQAHADGNAFTGQWYEPGAVTAEQPERMVWDDPTADRLPWVEVAQTLCPGPPYLDATDHWNGSYQCGRKHYHPRAESIRPYSNSRKGA